MFEPGVFCWADFHSAHPTGAANFYGGVLGWSTQEVDDTPNYRLFLSEGRAAAALSSLPEEQRKLGIPPHWMSYLAVAEVDATAKLVRKAGGRVVVAPFEAMQAGRMAVCSDPTGGHFCLWQARNHAGAAVVNEVGGMCWHELLTGHPGRAGKFYQRVFGWTSRDFRLGSIPYTMFYQGEQARAGMMPKPKGVAMPSLWLNYFQVADYAAAIERCKNLGGVAPMEPFEVEGVGCFCTLLDPEGAPFAVLSRPRASGA